MSTYSFKFMDFNLLQQQGSVSLTWYHRQSFQKLNIHQMWWNDKNFYGGIFGGSCKCEWNDNFVSAKLSLSGDCVVIKLDTGYIIYKALQSCLVLAGHLLLSCIVTLYDSFLTQELNKWSHMGTGCLKVSASSVIILCLRVSVGICLLFLSVEQPSCQSSYRKQTEREVFRVERWTDRSHDGSTASGQMIYIIAQHHEW